MRPIIYSLTGDPPPGYWELVICCEGEPDPGVIRVLCPGEALEAFVRVCERSGVELDPATVARVRVEVAAWSSSSPPH